MLLLCYPKCTTCQRAKKFLDDRGAAYTDRHIREDNPTADELRRAPDAALFDLYLLDVLMPGLNDSEENIAALAELLHRFNVNHVDILPCHFFGRNKYEALGSAHPSVREYAPDELHAVQERFAGCGLETEIV